MVQIASTNEANWPVEASASGKVGMKASGPGHSLQTPWTSEKPEARLRHCAGPLRYLLVQRRPVPWRWY